MLSAWRGIAFAQMTLCTAGAVTSRSRQSPADVRLTPLHDRRNRPILRRQPDDDLPPHPHQPNDRAVISGPLSANGCTGSTPCSARATVSPPLSRGFTHHQSRNFGLRPAASTTRTPPGSTAKPTPLDLVPTQASCLGAVCRITGDKVGGSANLAARRDQAACTRLRPDALAS